MSSPLESLGEVFSPDAPIQDPRALVGRRTELRDLLAGYASGASCVPVLVGPPGIGKSSLLGMVRQVLVGFPEVLEANGLSHCAPSNINRLAIEVRCNSDLVSEDSLSQEIVGQLNRIFDRANPRKRYQVRAVDATATVPFVKVKATWEASASTVGDSTSALTSRLAECRSEQIQEFVILLDECEQLPWLKRLLDFTRRFDAESCRFVLALRDHSAHELADPRRGDYRSPRHVQVGRLKRPEVEAVFERGSLLLSDLGITWGLQPEALTYIASHSAGEPWYLQMIGQELLLDPQAKLETRVTSSTTTQPAILRVNLDDVRRAEVRMRAKRLSGARCDRRRTCRNT